MTGLLERLHRLFTGKDFSELPVGAFGMPGSGDLSDVTVVLGADRLSERLPAGAFPVVVLECGDDEGGVSLDYAPAHPVALEVRLHIGTKSATPGGTIFPHLDVERRVRARLSSDPDLKLGGVAPYARLGFDVTTRRELGLSIVDRASTIEAVYEKKGR